MSRFFKVSSLVFTVLRKLLFIWVRSEIKGADTETLKLDPNKPVCYVLQYSSLSARLVLENACLRTGLPSSQSKLQLGDDEVRRSFFFLYERQGQWLRKRQSPTVTQRLKQIVHDVAENPEIDVQLIPVSLFWGRAPTREKSWLQLLLTESWSVASPLQQFLIILLHGRRTYVQFGQPMSMRDICEDCPDDPNRGARKTARILRVHFRRVRQTVIGPNLSHRYTLVNTLVNSSRVKEAIDELAETENMDVTKARQQAYKYADEIASNLQISTIHFLERMLNKLWNKIYRGINANHVDIVQEVTKDHAVVYVPCHRSHIDYLLLSSLLFAEGIMVPHIAAGNNLNLPVVGAILRRGGAFYMRRSFKGNKLYAAVFSEYIHEIFKRGYSVEYFVEGGRSRTGRTLPPRAGMVAMTVSSYLRDQKKPIAFVPVYFGYEKVLEGGTYLGELRGKQKQKESVFGLFKSLKNLRKSFGKVSVNFGEPIYLGKFLDEHQPDWKQNKGGDDFKPDWLPEVVDELALEIVTRINQAAAINPINLLAIVLLSTQRHAMDARVLANLMTAFADLLKQMPYSDYMSFPEGDGYDWLEYAETMGFVERQRNELGDIIRLEDRNAIMLTYNRNNIIHFFAIPSLIASLLQNHSSIDRNRLHKIFRAIYPYIRSEYFLPWESDEVDAVFDGWLKVMLKNQLLSQEGERLIRPEPGSGQFVQLSVLARFIMQTLERYYIVIAVLIKEGSGNLDAEQLEKQCTQMAERMSILFGLNAPEFFDKTLFRNFISKLQDKNVLREDEHGKLIYDEQIEQIADDARLILNGELRQAIIQVTSLH
ncbi:MAG: glycerol-3-phosphate 1-O-acyltransferase PlsB [Oleiphilaceae bacterium]|nr:glycerol-3-phosphate 1-O-acyltransferase PlsB [Oleiphilaceae bacterium]